MTEEYGVEPLHSGYAYKQLTYAALDYPKEIKYQHLLKGSTLGGNPGSTISWADTITVGSSSSETISESVMKKIEAGVSWNVFSMGAST
jgi:hypothetical protein